MIGKVVAAMVMAVITVFMIVIAQSVMTENMPADAPSSLQAIGSNIGPVIGVVGIIFMFLMIFAGSEVYKYIKYKKWRAFGTRLKEAYTAKFGYPNPGFEQEVDQHIKAMEALGHGYTKSIDEDWLKRMAKFVEVPWAIPEEERLSEVEKTEQYDETRQTSKTDESDED